MKVLRLILPILTCYATDLVVFDGEYFGRFATQFEVSAATQSLESATNALAGAWRPSNPLDHMADIGLCGFDNGRISC